MLVGQGNVVGKFPTSVESEDTLAVSVSVSVSVTVNVMPPPLLLLVLGVGTVTDMSIVVHVVSELMSEVFVISDEHECRKEYSVDVEMQSLTVVV